MGHEVIVIERNGVLVDRHADVVTRAVEGDATDPTVLRAAGAAGADGAVISTGESLATGILATVALRDIVQDHLRQIPTGGAGAERRFPERHAALLEKLLLDPEPSVVSEAARAVCEDPGIGSAYPALAALLEKNPDAREAALRRSIKYGLLNIVNTECFSIDLFTGERKYSGL
jgi:hypothetical protein